jgi:hypothetical protein
MPKAVLLNDTSHMLHAGSRLASRNIVALLNAEGFDVIYTTPHGESFQDDWIDAVLDHRPDIIVVHGEGGIHSSSTRPWVSRLLQAALDLKAELDVPLALVNSIADALGPDDLEMLACFDLINVRETRSRTYLAEYGIAAHVVPDFSLARPYPAAKNPRMGGLVIDSVVGSINADLSCTAQALNWHWMTMQPPLTRGRFPRFNKALRILRTDRLPIVVARSHPDRVLTYVANHKEVVTGRFHGLMFCLLTNTPFLAVDSNTHKITSVSIDVFGHADRVWSVSEILSRARMHTRKVAFVEPFNETEKIAVKRYLADCEEGAREVISRLARKI